MTNRLGYVYRQLHRLEGPVRYLVLDESQESHTIRHYLSTRQGSTELIRSNLFREEQEEFRQKYVDFLGQVNHDNQSWHWWSMPFTDKFPFDSDLCRNVFYVLLVAKLLKVKSDTLVIVTHSAKVAEQLSHWCGNNDIDYSCSVKVGFSIRAFLKSHTPAGIFRAAVRTFFFWLIAPNSNYLRGYNTAEFVVATVSHPHSFSTNGDFIDSYLGELTRFLDSQGRRPITLALILGNPIQQLRKLKSFGPNSRVVAVESLLTFAEICKCLMRSLWLYWRPVSLKASAETDGINLDLLVKSSVIEARHSGNVFHGLKEHCAAKYLAKQFKIERLFHIYENLPWQRMMIQAIRQSSPTTNIVGYQHAAVTPGHLNLILGNAEMDCAPLPDALFTTGPAVKELLESNGNYHPGILRVACALRQGQKPIVNLHKKPYEHRKVLMALATSVEEYIGALKYLEKATRKDVLANQIEFSLRIRPHPAIPLSAGVFEASLPRQDFFKPSESPLSDDLDWADVVIYASSTVGMEGVARGIPVIYLDLGDFVNMDPMHGLEYLNWTVSEPDQLATTLQEMDSISQFKYLQKQESGRRFVTNYFRPVTEDSLNQFLVPLPKSSKYEGI